MVAKMGIYSICFPMKRAADLFGKRAMESKLRRRRSVRGRRMLSVHRILRLSLRCSKGDAPLTGNSEDIVGLQTDVFVQLQLLSLAMSDLLDHRQHLIAEQWITC